MTLCNEAFTNVNSSSEMTSSEFECRCPVTSISPPLASVTYSEQLTTSNLQGRTNTIDARDTSPSTIVDISGITEREASIAAAPGSIGEPFTQWSRMKLSATFSNLHSDEIMPSVEFATTPPLLKKFARGAHHKRRILEVTRAPF